MNMSKSKRAMATLSVLVGSIFPALSSAEGVSVASGADPQGLHGNQVAATIRRVADWQLTHPAPFGPLHWAIAPLYNGLIDAAEATGDPKYLAAVMRAGNRAGWRPGPNIYHADDQAVGNAWLKIYLMDRTRTERLEPFRKRMDLILADPVTAALSFTTAPPIRDLDRTDRWTWSDALYMAPPMLARLAQATRDDRYLKFMDREYRFAFDALFDPKEELFYRDSRFIDRRTPTGQKVFWSRGNGWVYAGLAVVLEAMPADYANRSFYLKIFQEMTPAIVAAQQSDGLWYPSLKDPSQIPVGETSGSALFLYGLASGIRQGLVDRATYWPVVERGWNALLTRISPRGVVRFVQPVGAEPEEFDAESQAAFGSGPVLSLGAQILHILGSAAKVDNAKLLSEAEGLAPAAPDLSRTGRLSESKTGDAMRQQQAHSTTVVGEQNKAENGFADREYSVQVLTRIAEPVLDALSKNELKKRLPIHDWEKHRAAWTHYEAFARTLAGIAPWLELGPDDSPEGRLRTRYIDLARRSLINATDPNSPDYMNFGAIPDQPLVESAYLAAALMSAPRQLWEPLDQAQRTNVLNALRISRGIKLEHNNNWFLFPAMIQAALWRFGGDSNTEAVETALERFEDEWYLGDGIYGDGPNFHWDFYNSYVMHPMLLQILRAAQSKGSTIGKDWPIFVARARRYAEILERQISPEGTFPVAGRSSAYRFAAFYHLAYMALIDELPETIEPAAVRGGITAVVRRMIEQPGTFDEQGWLNLGAVGSQPRLREGYNATGSLYVCLTGLVHLGLPADDPFWTDPAASWTQQRIWAGEDVARDRILQRSGKRKSY
jgi:rhamnogalacturonyl hydrolase YesR